MCKGRKPKGLAALPLECSLIDFRGHNQWWCALQQKKKKKEEEGHVPFNACFTHADWRERGGETHT